MRTWYKCLTDGWIGYKDDGWYCVRGTNGGSFFRKITNPNLILQEIKKGVIVKMTDRDIKQYKLEQL